VVEEVAGMIDPSVEGSRARTTPYSAAIGAADRRALTTALR
jgi:hypothetical protein